MKQLHNVTSGSYGVIEDFLIMDDEPILGQWTITSKSYAHSMDGSYYPASVWQKKTSVSYIYNIVKSIYNKTIADVPWKEKQ